MHTSLQTGRLSLATPDPLGRAPGSAGSPAASLLRRVLIWLERYRQRRALLALDAWALKDIGLSPADVMQECEKPFWQD